MKLYHVTSRAAALSVESEGFRDARGLYLTDQEWEGVWVSDRPLDSNDFGNVIDDPAIFEIDIDESLVCDFEWVEEGKGYREWLVPAAILNAARTRRIG